MPQVIIENPVLNSPFTEPTRPDKCHLNRVVADTGSWEQKMAETLEGMDEVLAYVKNQNLGFTIPYVIGDEQKSYYPDFIVRMRHGREDELNLVLEVSGRQREDKLAKVNPPPPKAGRSVAAEETRAYGKLQVLLARMNPDLAMGDELLKKTGAGNLFMVFGEPDIVITREKDGVVVEIKGLDIYDPTTGAIRSHSTDDLACWFIDTDYNGESFFVRHAYFTGADRPYDKLKRALRAEIDEGAWEQLYATRSRPFPRPKTGRIAVKVINHFGDEVLKVYSVA